MMTTDTRPAASAAPVETAPRLDTPEAAAMARAIDWLVERHADQPSLEEAAAAAGLSPFHFQRAFKRWTGISPKRFCQYLTLGQAKRLLIEQASVLDAALEAGLSGPGRLHDLFVACEAMTPGEYKACGRDLEVRWGFHQGPLGKALLATTPRGLCWFGFVVDGDEAAAQRVFEEEWALARRLHDPAATAAAAAQAFGLADPAADRPLKLLLRGTNFQVKVWEALLKIPAGRLATYGTVAGAIGKPSASRAVGAAVGANPISLIIPCHRVILSSGAIHNYRWAPERKRALIAWETARGGAPEEAA
jgi:AraC family transcriptional regulator of adaptative response/methylated-DNA-[protein]-cysteine methyltransferase